MAGRIKGYQHDANTRNKIQAAALINRLHKIAMGEIDADPTQVNAAKALLNKCIPDLQSVQQDTFIEGGMDVRSISVKGVRNSSDSTSSV